MNQQKRQAKRFRIMAKGRMIPDGQGGEKPLWLEIGQITAFSANPLPKDVSFSVEVNQMPGNPLSAFPVERKGQGGNQGVYQQNQGGQPQAW